jgi:hypothetical protein
MQAAEDIFAGLVEAIVVEGEVEVRLGRCGESCRIAGFDGGAAEARGSAKGCKETRDGKRVNLGRFRLWYFKIRIFMIIRSE